jgi:hypothetical protein
MDPQATWDSLLDAWCQGEWQDVCELADAMLSWLDKDGFPPETRHPQRMGSDWNRVVVRAACEFVQQRAKSVLQSPGYLPPEVAFTLSCDTCNNVGPDDADQAKTQGWKELRYTPTGLSENFLGYCPNCQRTDRLRDAAHRRFNRD